MHCLVLRWLILGLLDIRTKFDQASHPRHSRFVSVQTTQSYQLFDHQSPLKLEIRLAHEYKLGARYTTGFPSLQKKAELVPWMQSSIVCHQTSKYHYLQNLHKVSIQFLVLILQMPLPNPIHGYRLEHQHCLQCTDQFGLEKLILLMDHEYVLQFNLIQQGIDSRQFVVQYMVQDILSF